MGWADRAKEQLQKGNSVQITPHGRSMEPLVHDGQLVHLDPIKEDVKVGDIVLVTVSGRDYLHKIISDNEQGRYLIGNNKGGINGWVSLRSIYGKMRK